MDDGTAGGGGRFEAIDSSLTVFALANGLDLAKGEDYRRLEWFSEGLERGIVIEVGGGGFNVRALTWRSRHADERTEHAIAEGLSASELRTTLPDAIETANGLEAPQRDE